MADGRTFVLSLLYFANGMQWKHAQNEITSLSTYRMHLIKTHKNFPKLMKCTKKYILPIQTWELYRKSVHENFHHYFFISSGSSLTLSPPLPLFLINNHNNNRNNTNNNIVFWLFSILSVLSLITGFSLNSGEVEKKKRKEKIDLTSNIFEL